MNWSMSWFAPFPYENIKKKRLTVVRKVGRCLGHCYYGSEICYYKTQHGKSIYLNRTMLIKSKSGIVMEYLPQFLPVEWGNLQNSVKSNILTVYYIGHHKCVLKEKTQNRYVRETLTGNMHLGPHHQKCMLLVKHSRHVTWLKLKKIVQKLNLRRSKYIKETMSRQQNPNKHLFEAVAEAKKGPDMEKYSIYKINRPAFNSGTDCAFKTSRKWQNWLCKWI